MILCFTLSMPNCNSQDWKWSGDEGLYARVINFGRGKRSVKQAEEILNKGYYSYNFGDGWCAGISVKKVDGKEGMKIRRKSRGFCGYDWMVDSIRHKGLISPDSIREQNRG